MAIQWECDLVERPFCEQLKVMGWQWLEGDTDVPELTERESFRDVLLKARLREALRRINPGPDGQPWLDHAWIERAIRELEHLGEHRLMEANQAATRLLVQGTVAEGMPDWDHGRLQSIRFIDFDRPENNDFLVINQFKVELASNFFEARAATIGAPPEAYLEWADTSPVPLSTVAEELGLIPRNLEVETEAAEELRLLGHERADRTAVPLFYRAPEQRPEAWRKANITLHSQQVLVAGMLRPAHLLDLVRNFTVFQQVEGRTRKLVARYQQFRSIHKAIARLHEGRTRSQGADRDERGGIIWHTQGSGKSLSMVFLVRKMRTLVRLRKFKIVAVTDRTDLERQLRETAALTGETVRPTERDLAPRESPTARTQRILRENTPDIVFAMLQKYQEVERKAAGDEKVAMTVLRKEKMPGKESHLIERQVTFEESIRFEEFPVLNESEDILLLVDEAHRSHTRALHRNLRRALPNAAIIGFTGTPILTKEKLETRDIFGDFIDKYVLQEAELDGATVPILYEGRTADGFVKDAPGLDQLFEDMFRDYTPEDLAIIKAKYATEGDVLEAPLLIEKKAKDMLRHYVEVVLPEGLKAQVVATSRAAAMTYHAKLEEALQRLLAAIAGLDAHTRALADDEIDKLDERMRFLVRAHRHLPLLRELEIGVVISGAHNDPESWWDWSDRKSQEKRIERFKRKLAPERTEKTDPLAILIVNNMLLTGFDAPVEQVLYLDRNLVAHDLLQAIARVNRTAKGKRCGYAVDYIGVARHLTQALDAYDREEIGGAITNISTELPRLLDRRARAVAVFTDQGISDLKEEVAACVEMLEDLRIRADFINKLRLFYESLSILEHRPEVRGDVFRDAKLLGFINKVAANLYRDPTLNLLGVPEKVKALIDAHVAARGIDPKIPPVAITDPQFEDLVNARLSARSRAAEMQHAARYHIVSFSAQNPAWARKMSEKLEEILRKFKEDFDALERELRRFIGELRAGDRSEFPNLDPRSQVPFVRLLLEELGKDRELTGEQRVKAIGSGLEMVERIRQEIRKVGFWRNPHAREVLTKALVRDLDDCMLCQPGRGRDLAQRLLALAKENHENLMR